MKTCFMNEYMFHSREYISSTEACSMHENVLHAWNNDAPSHTDPLAVAFRVAALLPSEPVNPPAQAKGFAMCIPFGDHPLIGTIHRRLAWPLRKHAQIEECKQLFIHVYWAHTPRQDKYERDPV
jgi:hypothetical protein